VRMLFMLSASVIISCGPPIITGPFLARTEVYQGVESDIYCWRSDGKLEECFEVIHHP
jgi:hypothetical protein